MRSAQGHLSNPLPEPWSNNGPRYRNRRRVSILFSPPVILITTMTILIGTAAIAFVVLRRGIL